MAAAEPEIARSSGLLRPFMPELDTLRGMAVLGVLFLHGFYWQYARLSFGKAARTFLNLTQPGWIGVHLFFVLSGFLITGILLDSKPRPDFYRRFYTRRALRILPPYYLLLLLLLVLRASSAAFVGLSFVYLSNMTEFFGVACDYGPLWSLAVEEHFYIAWPAVVRKLSSRHLAWFSAAIVVGIPVARAYSFAKGWTAGLDWYTWFVADGLATGALLAIVLRSAITRRQARTACGWLLGGCLVAALAGAPFGILTRNRILGASLQLSIIHLFFAGVLLIFLLVGSSSAKRFVDLGVLRFLGYISYGLYLDHMLAFRMYDRFCRHYAPGWIPSNGHFGLVVWRFVLAGGAAITAAYLSRRFYEEQFLRLKDSLVPRPAAEVRERVIDAGPAIDSRIA